MTRSTRRITALLSALLLLCGQAFPAFAVCACDHGDGMPCCDRPENHRAMQPAPAPAPQAEVRACCAQEAANTPDPDATAYGDSCCRRGLAPAGTSPAAVSPAPEVTAQVQPTLLAAGPSAPEAPATARLFAAAPWRGPPPGAPVPLFLLHSSLLS